VRHHLHRREERLLQLQRAWLGGTA
jgi:hypothetical protein